MRPLLAAAVDVLCVVAFAVVGRSSHAEALTPSGVGVALRLLSGTSAQPAFVVVATVTLGLLLVGWRWLTRLVQRTRRHAGNRDMSHKGAEG